MWLLVLLSMVSVATATVALVAGEARVFGHKSVLHVSRACIFVLTTLTQESEWSLERVISSQVDARRPK